MKHYYIKMDCLTLCNVMYPIVHVAVYNVNSFITLHRHFHFTIDQMSTPVFVIMHSGVGCLYSQRRDGAKTRMSRDGDKMVTLPPNICEGNKMWHGADM